MPTAYTSLLGLALPVTGELQGTWGTTVNDAITSLLDTAVAGTTTLSTDADVTLTTTTGASNQARQAIILWTANGSVTRNITAPAQSKAYIVINNSAGTQSIVIRGAGPTTGVTIIKGERAVVAWNGSDFVKVGVFNGALTVSDLTDSSLTSGRVTYATTGGNLTDSANLTFNGTTLTANALSLTTALSVPNGGTGLTSGTSGGLPYFNATNTMASSGLLAANALMIGGGAGAAPSTTTTATGILTFLGTPSSANLAAAVTDETGSGSLVFATSPTITTPTISSGNLSFSGTAQRITGDMSNATLANRLLFQTSTSNSSTTIAAIPNGTATASAIVAHNNSDPANSSSLSFLALTAETRIASGIQGTGTYLPITFYTTASERMRIDTSGNVGIGSTGASGTRLWVAASSTATANYYDGARVVFQNTSATNGNFVNLSFASSNGNDYAAIWGICSAHTVGAATGALVFGTTNAGAAATERMRITATGNVGIGGSPSYKFQVNGGSTAQWFLERSTGTTVTPPSSYSAAIDGFLCQVVADTTPFERFTDLVAGPGGAGSVMRMFTGQGAGAFERMRIDSLGNVGIGGVSGGARLDIITDAATSSMRFNRTGTYSGTDFASSIITSYNGDSLTSFLTVRDGANDAAALTFGTQPAGGTVTERMRIDSLGNVGIGTASPDQKLVVNDVIQAGTTGNNGALYLGGLNVSLRSAYSSNILGIYTSNSERMRIDSSGNVGIGTASPSQKLQVAATTNQLSLTTGTNELIARASSTEVALYTFQAIPMVFYTNNAERMRIDSSGNLLVGATSTVNSARIYSLSSTGVALAGRNSSAAAGKFWNTPYIDNNNTLYIINQDNTGVYIADGATAWTANSDERLKTDLKPIENAATKVASLRAVTGRFKTDEPGVSRAFLIAQDVLAVLPEAVNTSNPEQLGVAYTDTIPLLVAAIKEQQATIETLTRRIAALEAKG